MSDSILDRVRAIYWHRRAPQAWPAPPDQYAKPLPSEYDEHQAQKWAARIDRGEATFDDVRRRVEWEQAVPGSFMLALPYDRHAGDPVTSPFERNITVNHDDD